MLFLSLGKLLETDNCSESEQAYVNIDTIISDIGQLDGNVSVSESDFEGNDV